MDDDWADWGVSLFQETYIYSSWQQSNKHNQWALVFKWFDPL